MQDDIPFPFDDAPDAAANPDQLALQLSSREAAPKKLRGGRGIVLGYDEAEPPRRQVGFATPGAAKPGGRKPRTRRKLVTDDSDRHVLVVAPTGAGKGRNFIIPTLLHCADPAVVIDIKGELANTTAEYRAKMGHQIAIIDPWMLTKPDLAPYKSNFNPLAMLDPSSPTFADDCYAIASLLSPPGGLLQDPYWNERAEAVISGVIALVRSQLESSDGPAADRTMGAVYRRLHGEDVIYGLATDLDRIGRDMHPFAYNQIASFLSVTAEATRVGIVSSFQSLMRCFASDTVKASLRDGLDPRAVTDGRPLTIYLVMPPDKLASHKALMRLWVASLMGLISRRQTRPARRTLFVIDEAAQLGPLPQLRTAVTLMRGYGMRAIIVLQSLAQLKATFEKDWEVFAENCGVLMAFGIHMPSVAETLASWLGDITASRLTTLGQDHLAVRQGEVPTRVLRRIDMLHDRPFKDRLGSNPMYPGGKGLGR